MSALKLINIAAPEASDADLLFRFIARREESAFEELVRRHGPAVLRVCRRLVGPAQAEDAFQAVFLVLACKAKKVRKAASVGSWLIGVAGRVTRQMRQQLIGREVAISGDQDVISDRSLSPLDSRLIIPELAAALDEELTRLPDALRAPVVLCLVEGRTQEQAVTELGGSIRTLRRRLDRAKTLLRLRLERRGVVPALIAALIGNMQTSSAVSPELVRLTVHGVFEFLAGGPAICKAPALIAKGVVSNMTSFKSSLFVTMAALVAIGLGVVWAQDKPGNGRVDPLQQNMVELNKVDVAVPIKGKNVDYSDVFGPAAVKPKESHRSSNFVVHAPTPTMARAIAAEAEYQRTVLAKLWFGKELPRWEKPCEVVYAQTAIGSGTGTPVFSYGKANDGSSQLDASRIELNGDFLPVLTDVLPSQVMQVALHSHFGTILPRWVQGVATMNKPIEEQINQDQKCREFLNAGRGVRLNKLVLRAASNNDLDVLSAEGYSLTRFLIAQKVKTDSEVFKKYGLPNLSPQVTNGQQQFIFFLHLGMYKNSIESWNNAVRVIYGYENVDALEQAWLDYLKKPESVIKPNVNLPETIKGTVIDPDLIPPTTLPGAGKPPLQGR